MDFLFPDRHAADPRLGGKGAALAQLHDAGFAIPDWFAVPAELGCDKATLDAMVARLGGSLFAVRSSGTMEDGSEDSFAGQFESYLDVPPEQVAWRISSVRESATSEGILAYCRERYLPAPPWPTVLVQRMVAARSAGVAFSADPVSGNRGLSVIAAVQGTGEKLVSGETDGETWAVTRDAKIPVKPENSILSESEALDVANLAVACERHFGRPQDIEWAIDGQGKLWLLQSRPITTLGNIPDPNDPLRVWDNSNIAESYGGVTTPLTFSFARRIYEHVYREFCKLMSVPHDRIERADDVFPQMLGLIRGRTYYNLASWYRVLALLPGFQVNRAFMEQMMGVREPLPAALVETIIAESKTGKFSDTLALVRTCFGLVSQLRGLKKQIARFQERLDRALAPVDLQAMHGDALVAHYRDLERQLLRKWDAPLVNDFFAMIFYGVLRGLCKKWAGDVDGTLQNDLLANTGGIISAEPPKRILAMARLVAGVPGLSALLADRAVTQREKRKELKSHPELDAAFEDYLAQFGDRCLEELKLESPTVKDDASTLLCSIGTLAGNLKPEVDEPRAEKAAPKIWNPLKKLVFSRVLSQTRERIRCRENLRFERTRLFGRVRGILRELGKRLNADGRLDHPDDVFYLELAEIFDVWEGTETTRDLATLSLQRRIEFQEYHRGQAPPDRFETRGPVHRYEQWERPAEQATDSSDEIKGVGACPGIVRGKVRVVLDPRGATLQQGEILVARQTDPGWVVLFPSASGLLVERG
ncbi:MAG TPA: PEP/pyruvate-binding domain-containing protein, partial [Luteolibacter sp.]|nr:PEP/pyruvate-binding domain-containing protein [Luteolibacter sp.]